MLNQCSQIWRNRMNFLSSNSAVLVRNGVCFVFVSLSPPNRDRAENYGLAWTPAQSQESHGSPASCARAGWRWSNQVTATQEETPWGSFAARLPCQKAPYCCRTDIDETALWVSIIINWREDEELFPFPCTRCACLSLSMQCVYCPGHD